MGEGAFPRRDCAIKAVVLERKPRGEETAESLAGSALLISKPGIAAGVGLAGLAGMVLAERGMPAASSIVPCLASIIGAAAGAAILNGILDRALDARMPRVSERVEAMGRVGGSGALVLALVLILASLLLSVRFFQGLTAALVLAAVLSYSLLYTLFLKRRSPYGTIPGGIAGALPVLIGYSALAGRIGMDAVILFLVMILWQPPHFWTLALAHGEEYRDAGIPVLPVALGEPYTKILIFLYAVALLPASLALWAFGYCSGGFAAAAAALWGYFLWSCHRNAVRRRRFRSAFGASILYIMGILLAVIVDLSLRPLP